MNLKEEGWANLKKTVDGIWRSCFTATVFLGTMNLLCLERNKYKWKKQVSELKKAKDVH